MLKNAYLLANIGADTAENGQHFAESLTKFLQHSTPSGTVASGLICPGKRSTRDDVGNGPPVGEAEGRDLRAAAREHRRLDHLA